jgi:CRISPR-associated protein Cas1
VTAEYLGGPLPISLVAHHAFCPRRAWLEAMGETMDTHQMAVGEREHGASDDPAASRPGRVRSVEVASAELGVIGRYDTVEFDDAGAATRADVTEPMVVQLALQV